MSKFEGYTRRLQINESTSNISLTFLDFSNFFYIQRKFVDFREHIPYVRKKLLYSRASMKFVQIKERKVHARGLKSSRHGERFIED